MPIGEVLLPLAERYLSWLALSPAATADTTDEEPGSIRAMPVILRIERRDPPRRTPLLEAAAAAAVALCLDARAAPGGEWSDEASSWIDGRIRKIARRARGAHWSAVTPLPGVTVEVDGAEARALLPGRIAEAPKEVTRLQISGSDLPADEEPGTPPAGVPLLLLNPDAEMTAGKAAAQVGHATMLLAAALVADGATTELAAWRDAGCRVAVRTPSPAGWNERLAADPERAWRDDGLVAVRDAGFTEVAPGTVTVLAQRAH